MRHDADYDTRRLFTLLISFRHLFSFSLSPPCHARHDASALPCFSCHACRCHATPPLLMLIHAMLLCFFSYHYRAMPPLPRYAFRAIMPCQHVLMPPYADIRTPHNAMLLLRRCCQR